MVAPMKWGRKQNYVLWVAVVQMPMTMMSIPNHQQQWLNFDSDDFIMWNTADIITHTYNRITYTYTHLILEIGLKGKNFPSSILSVS